MELFKSKVLAFVTGCFLGSVVMASPMVEPVSIRGLDRLSPNTIGTHTGPIGLWSNSDPKELMDLFNRASKIIWSPAERDVLVHLLLTDTTDAAWPAVYEIDDVAFLTARLQTLFELGAFQEVVNLMRFIPEQYQTSEMLTLAFYAYFFMNETQEACRIIESQDLKDFEKMKLLCFLANDKKDQAVLAYDLYREHSSDQDILFKALGDAVFQEQPFKKPSEFILMPYHLPLIALLPEAEILLSDNFSMWVLNFMKHSKNISPKARLQATERLGGSVSEIKTAYEKVESDKNADGILKRAELVKKIFSTDKVSDRIRFVNEYVVSARNAGIFVQTAPLMAEAIRHIKPDAKYKDLTSTAIDVFVSVGNVAVAHLWYQTLEEDSFDALEKAAIIHAVGMGLPSLGKLTDLCRTDANRCMHLVDRLKSHFVFQDVLDYALIPEPHIKSYPPVVVAQIEHLKNGMKEGEAVLRGLILLNSSVEFEEELLQTVRSMLPKGAADSLERERLFSR